jgi:hypothetical protein
MFQNMHVYIQTYVLQEKIQEASKAASGEISPSAFWADYTRKDDGKILMGNSDDESEGNEEGEESEEVSDEEHHHKHKQQHHQHRASASGGGGGGGGGGGSSAGGMLGGVSGAVRGSVSGAGTVFSTGMTDVGGYLSKAGKSFRESIDDQEMLNALSANLGSFDKDTFDFSHVSGGMFAEEYEDSDDEGGAEGGGGGGGGSVKKEPLPTVNISDLMRKGSTMMMVSTTSSAAPPVVVSAETVSDGISDNKKVLDVTQLPESHRPSLLEVMFASLGGPGNPDKFLPQNIQEEEYADLPAPNQLAGFLVGLDTPQCY